MKGVRTRKRGKRSVGNDITVGIVMQNTGVVVTDVTSNNTVTVFPDTWVIPGPWINIDQIESLSDVEPS